VIATHLRVKDIRVRHFQFFRNFSDVKW